MNINEDTTYKNAFVHQLKQLALFSNPFPSVYFPNLTEKEESRLGKEANKAEPKSCPSSVTKRTSPESTEGGQSVDGGNASRCGIT